MTIPTAPALCRTVKRVLRRQGRGLAIASAASSLGLRHQVSTLPSSLPWCQPEYIQGSVHQTGIPSGLRYCRDWISKEEEAELDQILSEGEWLRILYSRAQQFFGVVYYQTTHNVHALQPAEQELQQGRPMKDLPSWLLTRLAETGVFPADSMNQVAANEYIATAGISHHVEDPISFGPNLATLSLLAPVQLTLTPADEPAVGRTGYDHGNWVKVLLEPRSLLVLQGESRYSFTHGIRRSKHVVLADGSHLKRDDRYRRVSLTFRELLETRRQLAASPGSLQEQACNRLRWAGKAPP